jgi:hypothetical protein
MSKELGLAVLQPGYADARIPVMEHLMPLSREAVIHFSGIDPVVEPNRVNEAFRIIAERFEQDLNWGIGLPIEGMPIYDWSDGATVKLDGAGNTVAQWGIFGALHQEGGRHLVHIPKPNSVEEALAFQPLEHFPRTIEDYKQTFQTLYDLMLASVGDTCYPIPHHYTTCFHWPLAIFGFETFCLAGVSDEDRFHELMSEFAEISIRITTAWSQIEGVRAFILHDDLSTSRGPIFSPSWYRRHVFPHYPSIFAPLKEKEIPVIFTSDGNCTEFVDDIFEAGADGLNFEHFVDLEMLVERYPDKILIGNINSSTLARGTFEDIEHETRRCMETGSRARRFVVNVAGGLTHDIPIENLECYLECRKTLAHDLRTR